MSKKENKDLLTKEQRKELESLLKEITEEAKLVMEDYSKNPSKMSGSLYRVHQNSPLLGEDKKDVD